MLALMQQGQWILWLIILCGVLAVFILLERAFHLHRARIKADDFLKGVCNILRRDNIAEALSICEETPGPVAFMTRAAILRRGSDIQTIERAMTDAALTELSRMERPFAMLATIAQIAPLLGLLGTVWGMIQTFLLMQQKAPLVHAGDLASGIWRALIATAAGLAVAILSYAGYNLLVSKVNRITLDMEQAFGGMLGFFNESELQKTETQTATERQDRNGA